MQYCLNNIIFNELSEYLKYLLAHFFTFNTTKCNNNYCNIDYFFTRR